MTGNTSPGESTLCFGLIVNDWNSWSWKVNFFVLGLLLITGSPEPGKSTLCVQELLLITGSPGPGKSTFLCLG